MWCLVMLLLLLDMLNLLLLLIRFNQTIWWHTTCRRWWSGWWWWRFWRYRGSRWCNWNRRAKTRKIRTNICYNYIVSIGYNGRFFLTFLLEHFITFTLLFTIFGSTILKPYLHLYKEQYTLDWICYQNGKTHSISIDLLSLYWNKQTQPFTTLQYNWRDGGKSNKTKY